MATHTISVLVENHSGALSRIAGLFSSRGYNITSLTVAETDDPTTSRMTIVVSGDEEILEQVVKQLNRLIDVIKVIDFAGEQALSREMVLIKLDGSRTHRQDIFTLAQVFGAKVAGVSHTSVTLELTAPSEEIENFIGLVKPFGLKEMVRSGKIALAMSKGK